MYVFSNFYKRVLNSIWCMVRTEWFLFSEFPSFISSALLQDQRRLEDLLGESVRFPVSQNVSRALDV